MNWIAWSLVALLGWAAWPLLAKQALRTLAWTHLRVAARVDPRGLAAIRGGMLLTRP